MCLGCGRHCLAGWFECLARRRCRGFGVRPARGHVLMHRLVGVAGRWLCGQGEDVEGAADIGVATALLAWVMSVPWSPVMAFPQAKGLAACAATLPNHPKRARTRNIFFVKRIMSYYIAATAKIKCLYPDATLKICNEYE